MRTDDRSGNEQGATSAAHEVIVPNQPVDVTVTDPVIVAARSPSRSR